MTNKDINKEINKKYMCVYCGEYVTNQRLEEKKTLTVTCKPCEDRILKNGKKK